MPTLKNQLIQIEIKHKGAELCSILSLKNNVEFIWQADPEVWGSHAPNLFPIIGAMKDNSYIYEGKLYNMPKHGFVRHNENFKIISETETKITFSLHSNNTSRTIYPFEFEFLITYKVKDNILLVEHTVRNIDNKSIYFSLGGHPAFNCPIHNEDAYTDHFLEFEKPETSKSYKLNMGSGLVSNHTKSVFEDGNKIYLQPDLFNEDALIFKDIKSRKVTLKHKDKGKILTVSFKKFPFLGIWAKPKAPYVCIEPWIGIADSETSNQQIKEKEGVISLLPNKDFTATYSIEIEKSLVN